MYPFKTIQKPVVVIEGLPQTQVEETDNSPVEELFTLTLDCVCLFV